MRVISRKPLRKFWEEHPDVEEPLRTWESLIKRGKFSSFSELVKSFTTADYVPPFTVFNIGGNKYRLIAIVHYDKQRVYVRKILTHAVYSRGQWRNP